MRRYERVRVCALGQGLVGEAVGLHLLQSQGMLRWLEDLPPERPAVPEPPPPRETTVESQFPVALEGEVISILASMTLAVRKGGDDHDL